MFPVCTIDPIDPMNPIDPIDSIDPINLMNPIDPMNPLDPIDPIIYAQNNPRNQTPKQPPSGGCFAKTTPLGVVLPKQPPLS